MCDGSILIKLLDDDMEEGAVVEKRALVLGAGGFIGGHLVESLVKDGYFVRAVDQKLPEFRVSVANEFLLGDLRNVAVVEKSFALPTEHVFDEVYQLAADMGGATYINDGKHNADVMSNSILINAHVAKSCVKFGAKKLFFASSACVYPQAEKDFASCYEDDVYPAFPDNEYGWEKLFSERMYTEFQKQYGLKVRIARFHSIVGDYSTWCGGKEKAHSALARKVAMAPDGGSIEVIGDGTQTRTFLYINDCVRGIRMLMLSDCREVINIGSDSLITINEYLDLLRKISKKDFSISYVPGPTGVKDRHCHIEKARRLIGWQPLVSLEEASRVTYEWIVQQIQERDDSLLQMAS